MTHKNCLLWIRHSTWQGWTPTLWRSRQVLMQLCSDTWSGCVEKGKRGWVEQHVQRQKEWYMWHVNVQKECLQIETGWPFQLLSPEYNEIEVTSVSERSCCPWSLFAHYVKKKMYNMSEKKRVKIMTSCIKISVQKYTIFELSLRFVKRLWVKTNVNQRGWILNALFVEKMNHQLTEEDKRGRRIVIQLPWQLYVGQ